MTREEAMRLRARNAKRLIERVTAPVERCTERERGVYDSTLVGITHRADRWERDDDGALVLVMAPRGARSDGGSVTSNATEAA